MPPRRAQTLLLLFRSNPPLRGGGGDKNARRSRGRSNFLGNGISFQGSLGSTEAVEDPFPRRFPMCLRTASPPAAAARAVATAPALELRPALLAVCLGGVAPLSTRVLLAVKSSNRARSSSGGGGPGGQGRRQPGPIAHCSVLQGAFFSI